MIAGTVIVGGSAGPLPGYLMRRGTIVVAGSTDLSPTFIDCGTHDLIALRLLATFVASYSARAARVLQRSLRRFAGDMAVLGRGEIFLAGLT
jgi:formylmethanofuran dehydrogenase subunit C